MGSFVPVLHIGNDLAGRSTSVDIRVLLLGALLASLATAGIWLPALHPRLHVRRRTRRLAAIRLAALLVVLAIVPNVFPFEHVLVHHHDAAQEESEAHALHCHISPGTCSDQPMLSGPGQLLFGDPLLREPALTETAVIADEPAASGLRVAPDVPPPRA